MLMLQMSETKKLPIVLIIEDDPTTQSLLTNLLARLSISAQIAKDGSEARSALVNQTFDLVFMDINLPGASGLELCSELRSKEKGAAKRTLIVALTGMDSPDARKICLDAGMDGYFSKPIDRLKLQGFVKNLFKL